MERTVISQVPEAIGKEIKISGFVHIIRDQGSIIFILIRDISATVQAVVLKQNTDAFQTAKGLTHESVVEIVGKVKTEKNAPNGFELEVQEIKILSRADPELPIPVVEKPGQQETDQSIRLDWRWIDLRKPEKALIFKVWTTMEQAFREYCVRNGFLEIHSPKLTATATESGSELFAVKYFDDEARLAQSPQLYKQMAMAAGFERVFEVGPVFRANPSFTSRHDTEFTMYDIEMSYIESHHDLMDEEERMIRFMLSKVKEEHGEDILKYYNRDLQVPADPMPRFTLKEVKEITGKLGIPDERDGDMSPEEERAISEYALREHGSEFVFIHEFPTKVRAFYSMRKEDDPTLTKSFDLLWNGIEITSGAQREHRVEQLEKQIAEQGLDTASFKTYLDFFRYGCPPHGGFAPGPSRMIMKIFGLSNVREATYLYRGVKRLTP
jgi:aspartyl-tRNA synthetase